jgi:glycosidase
VELRSQRGFHAANPQRLILPIIIDPEYHYEAINVEAQQNNPNSLLWWTKRLIALRKQFQAFGRGTIEFLTPQNYRVLAFVRKHGDETVLVVANLSRLPAVRRAGPGRRSRACGRWSCSATASSRRSASCPTC